jgi:hypothetical protein
MIAGIHFEVTFAPTLTNTMVQTIFALALYFLQQLGIISKEDLEQTKKEEWIIGNLFDIVQAFVLNSELDPEKNPIYTYLPLYWKQSCELQGINFDPTDLILLLKSQYGSAQNSGWTNSSRS